MSRATRPATAALVALASALLAVECRTTQGPGTAPSAALEAPPSDLETAAFDALIGATEAARGLSFVQRPVLEVLDEGDPRFAAVRAAMAFALEGGGGPSGGVSAERVAVDAARARIVALRPVAPEQVRLALAFLLDAQHYPTLVDAARRATGDVGLTLRGLLLGSALATAGGGLGPPPEAPATPAADPLAGPRFRGDEALAGLLGPLPALAAQGYLRGREDREAAFRAPPLSTEQLLRPAEGHGADRPVWLAGAIATPPGCAVASDESVGLYTLLRALVQRGAEVPARGLGAWSGDRLVRWRCGEDSASWLYVAELEDEAGARAFAAAAPELLPLDLGGEPILQRRGRRVVVSVGLAAADADAIARRLEAVELRSAEQAIALTGGGP